LLSHATKTATGSSSRNGTRSKNEPLHLLILVLYLFTWESSALLNSAHFATFVNAMLDQSRASFLRMRRKRRHTVFTAGW